MTPAVLERAFRRALAGIDLSARVRHAVSIDVPASGDVDVLSIGKAAPSMASGALAALGPRAGRVLIVAPDGARVSVPGADALLAAHPLPDVRSVRAAERALSFVATARSRVVLVLISGGASSLVCAPYGMTLARKVAITRALLHANVTISDVNTVRRHLSWIKGGGLAREARVPLVTLLASDVIRGGAHDVGSGPSVADPTTCADARAILERHLHLHPRLRETLAPRDARAPHRRARIVASPLTMARALASELERAGLRVRVLAAATRDIARFASEYARWAHSLAAGEAIVRAAEPTVSVNVSRPGRGGRSSHLAAMVARSLPRDVAFLAGATDGVDGSSRAAGAVVDARFMDVGVTKVERALATFDTATLHERSGTAIVTGPTGHNLADVHVLARLR
jgi:glycerate 2-kinase